MEPKCKTRFILIARSSTCHPNHDMGPFFYLRIDARPNLEFLASLDFLLVITKSMFDVYLTLFLLILIVIVGFLLLFSQPHIIIILIYIIYFILFYIIIYIYIAPYPANTACSTRL